MTPIRKGRWCPSREEAWQAAVRAKVANKDELGRIFLDVFTEIEREELPPNE